MIHKRQIMAVVGILFLVAGCAANPARRMAESDPRLHGALVGKDLHLLSSSEYAEVLVSIKLKKSGRFSLVQAKTNRGGHWEYKARERSIRLIPQKFGTPIIRGRQSFRVHVGDTVGEGPYAGEPGVLRISGGIADSLGTKFGVLGEKDLQDIRLRAQKRGEKLLARWQAVKGNQPANRIAVIEALDKQPRLLAEQRNKLEALAGDWFRAQLEQRRYPWGISPRQLRLFVPTAKTAADPDFSTFNEFLFGNQSALGNTNQGAVLACAVVTLGSNRLVFVDDQLFAVKDLSELGGNVYNVLEVLKKKYKIVRKKLEAVPLNLGGVMSGQTLVFLKMRYVFRRNSSTGIFYSAVNLDDNDPRNKRVLRYIKTLPQNQQLAVSLVFMGALNSMIQNYRIVYFNTRTAARLKQRLAKKVRAATRRSRKKLDNY